MDLQNTSHHTSTNQSPLEVPAPPSDWKEKTGLPSKIEGTFAKN